MRARYPSTSTRGWSLLLGLLMLGCGEGEPTGKLETVAVEQQSPADAHSVPIGSTPAAVRIENRKPALELTDSAATALREMANRELSQSDFFFCLKAEKAGPTIDYDVQIRRTASQETYRVVEVNRVRVAIEHSSVPLVRGAKLDYQSSGEKAGFRFDNPNEARIAEAVSRKAEPYSNIYPDDYVGPETCGECHTRQHELWSDHPHSKMNQIANAETVIGDFSNQTIKYSDALTEFKTDNDQDGAPEFIMSVSRNGEFVRSYRVTRTVGSRVFQMYMGTQLDGPEPKDDAIYREERKLPFAYSIERDEWFPETYDEPRYVPEFGRDGKLTAEHAIHTRNFRAEWQESCIWCHNTFPYHARLQKQMVGFPPKDVWLDKVLFPIEYANGSLRSSR